MKTPEQIRDMEFQKSPMGGYKQSDVELFLEEVASQIEILMKQKADSDRKLQEFSKKAPEAALSTAGLQNVLISAQRVADQITDDAKSEAERIIAEANLKLTEANLKAKEIIAEAEKNAIMLGKTAETEAAKIIAAAVEKSETTVAAAKESVELQQKLYDRLKIEISDFRKKTAAQCGSVIELINQLPGEIPFNIERAKTVLAIDFGNPEDLLNKAVDERLAKERAEKAKDEEKAAAEIKAVEAEKATVVPAEKEIKSEVKREEHRPVTNHDATIPVQTAQKVVAGGTSDMEAASETVPGDDDGQLSFAQAAAEQKTAEKPSAAGFIIDGEERKPAVKGHISFGDEDDDDDDDEPRLFFRKRKK